MNNLKEDIANKLNSRLKQVFIDHITLCEIAEIPPAAGAAMLFAAIINLLAQGIEATNMSPEQSGEIIAEGVRAHRAKEAEANE